MSAEEMLKALQDIRLPAEAPGGFLAELSAALGFGLLLAALAGWLLARISQAAAERALHDRHGGSDALADDLSDADRAVALLHRLKRIDPERARALSDRLYAPGGLPEAELIEAALAETRSADV